MKTKVKFGLTIDELTKILNDFCATHEYNADYDKVGHIYYGAKNTLKVLNKLESNCEIEFSGNPKIGTEIEVVNFLSGIVTDEDATSTLLDSENGINIKIDEYDVWRVDGEYKFI